MLYFRAWYVREREAPTVDERFPEWVIYAADEAEAQAKVLAEMQRSEPDHGFRVVLMPFDDEEAGIVAFATARQQDQAIL